MTFFGRITNGTLEGRTVWTGICRLQKAGIYVSYIDQTDVRIWKPGRGISFQILLTWENLSLHFTETGSITRSRIRNLSRTIPELCWNMGRKNVRRIFFDTYRQWMIF